MKKIWAILLMSAAAPAVAASVYECSGKNGQTTYTQNPSGSHCRPANLGAPSIYSAAPAPAIRNTEAPAAAHTTNSQQNDVQRAQEELAQAQKNLEASRQVRYGNERNYVRYQQRIQGLEQAVQNARQKLEQAQGGQIAD